MEAPENVFIFPWQTGWRASHYSEPQLYPTTTLTFLCDTSRYKNSSCLCVTENANTLTRRSAIWFTVTALFIHCLPVKCRVMSWQFIAFMSSRIATKSQNAIKARYGGFIRSWNTRNGPCGVLALISPLCRFPAPLEATATVMWQWNMIILQVWRHMRTRFVPHWCDNCKPAPSSRTSDNDPKQKWDDSGGTDWWWNDSVKSVPKIKLWLIDGIVFATAQSQQ